MSTLASNSTALRNPAQPVDDAAELLRLEARLPPFHVFVLVRESFILSKRLTPY
jgi:hypothetical protein